jgi:hypothetical protein
MALEEIGYEVWTAFIVIGILSLGQPVVNMIMNFTFHIICRKVWTSEQLSAFEVLFCSIQFNGSIKVKLPL